MKRWAAMLLVLCLAGFAQSDEIDRKLGPGLRAILSDPAGRLMKAGVYPGIDEEGCVRVFVRGDSPTTAIDAIGGMVQSDLGRIVTARVPLDGIKALAESKDVDFIRLGRRVYKRNDEVVEDLRADVAHAGGAPLPQSYTGEGVVVGIIDTGIDIDHEDFQNPDGSTRIYTIWDQLDDSGPNPAGYNYGTEWIAAQINAGTCLHEDPDGHGTHVAGTAAGNGRAIGDYGGVAPDAHLVIVGLDFMSSVGVIDGANYIYQKADALGLPCVINASLGWHQGMHDGTSADEQAIDAMVQAKTGRAFCAAAGNEATDFIHLTFPNTADSLFSYYHAGPDGIVMLYVRVPDAFLATTKFSIGVDDHDFDPIAETGGPISYLGSTPWYSTQDVLNDGNWEILETIRPGGVNHGRVTFAIDVASNSRGATGMIILIEDTDLNWDDDAGIVENLDIYRLNVWGGKPSIHVWLADVGMPYVNGIADARYRALDNDYSVGLPATSEKIIAVGASTNRTTFLSQDGYTYVMGGTEGDLADFSSRGPSGDGRLKPDITTPGHGVISSLSAAAEREESFWPEDIVPGGKHAVSSGTSMASPGATGGIALYLQQNPGATVDEIYHAVTRGTRSDGFTGGSLPNNDWGYGKMDVVNMLTGTAVDDEGHLPSVFVLNTNYPNPFNASTMISYTILSSTHVELRVYNVEGQLVDTLLNGFVQAGLHRIRWDAEDVGSGVYHYRLTAGGRSLTGKCLLLK